MATISDSYLSSSTSRARHERVPWLLLLHGLRRGWRAVVVGGELRELDKGEGGRAGLSAAGEGEQGLRGLARSRPGRAGTRVTWANAQRKEMGKKQGRRCWGRPAGFRKASSREFAPAKGCESLSVGGLREAPGDGRFQGLFALSK